MIGLKRLNSLGKMVKKLGQAKQPASPGLPVARVRAVLVDSPNRQPARPHRGHRVPRHQRARRSVPSDIREFLKLNEDQQYDLLWHQSDDDLKKLVKYMSTRVNRRVNRDYIHQLLQTLDKLNLYGGDTSKEFVNALFKSFETGNLSPFMLACHREHFCEIFRHLLVMQYKH